MFSRGVFAFCGNRHGHCFCCQSEEEGAAPASAAASTVAAALSPTASSSSASSGDDLASMFDAGRLLTASDLCLVAGRGFVLEGGTDLRSADGGAVVVAPK